VDFRGRLRRPDRLWPTGVLSPSSFIPVLGVSVRDAEVAGSNPAFPTPKGQVNDVAPSLVLVGCGRRWHIHGTGQARREEPGGQAIGRLAVRFGHPRTEWTQVAN